MKPPPRPAVLLLDAGNTVVFLDTSAVAEVARAHGAPVSGRALHDARGAATRRYEAFLRDGHGHERGWDVFMSALLRAGGVGDAQVESLLPHLWSAHMELNFWRRVPPGLPEALDRLAAAGTRLGVVSNSEGKIAELLEAVGLASRFEVIVDSGVEGVSKPDPEIFRRALERLGARPADGVYVGDIPDVDVAGARAAGLEAVLCDPFDLYPGYADAARVDGVTTLIATWA